MLRMPSSLAFLRTYETMDSNAARKHFAPPILHGDFLDDFPSVSEEAAIAVLEMARLSLTSEKLLHENFA